PDLSGLSDPELDKLYFAGHWTEPRPMDRIQHINSLGTDYGNISTRDFKKITNEPLTTSETIGEMIDSGIHSFATTAADVAYTIAPVVQPMAENVQTVMQASAPFFEAVGGLGEAV